VVRKIQNPASKQVCSEVAVFAVIVLRAWLFFAVLCVISLCDSLRLNTLNPKPQRTAEKVQGTQRLTKKSDTSRCRFLTI
jgi:hypothetical protein